MHLRELYAGEGRGNTWYDPHRGMQVQFPNTYRDGWVNSLGDYVFADSPGYNPNVEDNRSWSRMEQR